MKIEPTDPSRRARAASNALRSLSTIQKMDARPSRVSGCGRPDYMKMEEASLKGFSWATSIEALKKFAALSDDQIENFHIRPCFGIRHASDCGIDADLPYDRSEDVDAGENADDADQAATEGTSVPSLPERIQFAMKSYEVSPTSLTTAFRPTCAWLTKICRSKSRHKR